MERKTMNIRDLIVPYKMKKYTPKKYKVMGMEAYHKKYKHFYGSVIVDKNFKIIDGYVIFYTAKRIKVYEVPVTIVSKKDRLKHFIKGVLRKWNIK